MDMPLSSLLVETSMKYVLSICIILALLITAYCQQPGADLLTATPNQPQPDPTGQRLQHLRKTVYELEQAGKREQAAAIRQQADLERQALLRRLNALQIEAEQIRQAMGDSTQVVVKLQIGEVSLTKLRRLGLDLAKLSGEPDAKSKLDQTGGNAQQSQAIATSSVIDDGSEAQRFLETLRKDNLVKILAEPTLMTLSGKTAVINSGSELPVPKRRPDGSMAIENHCGTEIEVTPEVFGDTIHLAILGRVSELDFGHMVRVGQQTVPGIGVREFCTRTELKSGQTLAISGLSQTRLEAISRGLPWVSEVPYVGAIFRSVKEERNEIAMLIIVRPEIAQPPATASHFKTANIHRDAPDHQFLPPATAPGYAPPAMAHRSADGDTNR
jgi:Flp pilus assembly secretin CpaC